MTALTITAVTPATDTLTIAAHGLNTGDGFIAIYTPNGSIPGGLAAVTDYWAIRVDANNVKLASSSTNAMAGTAIDITSAGSGTLQLLRNLPYRVPRIAAAGTQVFSADDNATWQSLVAMWNLLTGQAQSIFGDILLAVNLTLGSNKNLTLSGTGAVKRGSRTRHLPGSAAQMVTTPAATTTYYNGTAAQFRSVGNVFEMPLLLEEGERLLSVVVQTSCGSTDVVTAKVFKQANTAGLTPTSNTQLGSTATSANHTNVIELISVTGLTEVAAGAVPTQYFVEIGCAAFANSPQVYGVYYTTDVP